MNNDLHSSAVIWLEMTGSNKMCEMLLHCFKHFFYSLTSHGHSQIVVVWKSIDPHGKSLTLANLFVFYRENYSILVWTAVPLL